MTEAVGTDAADAEATPVTEPELLNEPRDGVPPVVESSDALAETIAAFDAGTGPVAVDAERASGYRYSQRAYLVQIRRAGAGTALIDPIACPDLGMLGAAIMDAEWVLHAATQDLPCLSEIGLRPLRLFDTELAGRLAGLERVGLGAMAESILGYRLEKGHSAADWSTRPLPEPWLRYAALDVELLIDLRDALEAELDKQGKLAWAHEEFAALTAIRTPPQRPDPWRRTSGIHRLRSRRQLAAARALWEARNEIARARDLAPGRVLPDSAIVDAVLTAPESEEALVRMPVFRGRATRRYARTWYTALAAAAALPEDGLPQAGPPGEGPPAPHRWAERDPAAAARLAVARGVIRTLSAELNIPAENLIPPDAVRRLAWSPPREPTEETVAAQLAESRARAWQIGLLAGRLAEGLASEPPVPNDSAEEPVVG
ncbi:MAG: ribonuclease [Frankiales bacterium]|nr:ribonuclease [Frankiales bacterium]